MNTNITRAYLSVSEKFTLAFLFALLWLGASVWFSYPWLLDLSKIIGLPLASFFILSLAIIPGFINSFVAAALLFDKRPKAFPLSHAPDITILLPVYNDGDVVESTIKSLLKQDYPGKFFIILINDGSTDRTAHILQKMAEAYSDIEFINLEENIGKARALNTGLKKSRTDLVISVDADCWVKEDAVKNLVARYLSDPKGTKAVAGTILIRNSRENWITRAQEWDYFLGIASIKRIQSLFQGTLVAQGAFSLYDREVLNQIGGWPNTVGEDIVLTWKLLNKGYRIGYAEDACVFTNCPNTLAQFVRQRQRWSRGLIEAFIANPGLLFKPRLTLMFIWWNFFFPLIDTAYTLGFIPGLVLAAFGKYWIIGPMTLALIPPGLLINQIMFHAEKEMFDKSNLRIRNNIFGFIFYVIAYGIVLQPACVWGYISELFKLKKHWGTK
jgi:biofilm PGA synthesis N-glycosyltransferase PgaC